MFTIRCWVLKFTFNLIWISQKYIILQQSVPKSFGANQISFVPDIIRAWTCHIQTEVSYFLKKYLGTITTFYFNDSIVLFRFLSVYLSTIAVRLTLFNPSGSSFLLLFCRLFHSTLNSGPWKRITYYLKILTKQLFMSLFDTIPILVNTRTKKATLNAFCIKGCFPLFVWYNIHDNFSYL